MENNNTSKKEELGLRPIIVGYLLQWKLFFGVGIFAILLGILYLVLYPKTYETVARVQIQDENDPLSTGSLALGEAAGLMKSFGLGGGASGSIVIDDEIATFTSNDLLSEMVNELGLYAEYSEPFSLGRKLYEERNLTVTTDSSTIVQLDKIIECNVSVSPNNIQIKVKIKSEKFKKTFQFSSFPAVIQLKQGEFIFDQTEIGKEKSSYKLNIKIKPLTFVANGLMEEFQIEEISKTSNVIEFIVSDYERQRSKDMFNTLIKNYNIRAKAFKNELGQMSMNFLENRINLLMKDLSNIESDIEAYKRKNKMTMVEMDVQYYAEYMKELQVKMIEAEAQAHIIKLMDAFIKNPANHYKLVPSLLAMGSSESETSPLALYNQALLERERIIKNSGIDNPLVAPLTMQIDKLRESVYQMIENAVLSADLVITELKEKEKSILSRMGEVPEQERVYFDLKRQQEILQGVYLILLQKREEIALSIGQSKNKAKVIDPAYTKPLPIAPRKLYAALGVIVLTLVISIGYIELKKIFLTLKNDFLKAK